MNGPFCVLLVDDDVSFARTTAEVLRQTNDRLAVETATSASEGLELFDQGSFDCIVSDYEMPELSGIEFLEAVREDDPEVPFVLLTGKGSETVASEAISAGVTDYFRKGTGQSDLLANRIENLVTRYRLEREADEFDRPLRELTAVTDDVHWMFAHDWSDLHFLSPSYEEVWGQPVGELEDDPREFLCGEAIHPDDRDRVENRLGELSAGESVDLEYRVNAADDYRRWVWVRGHPITDGDTVVRVAGFARDITVRKERELELMHEGQFVEELVENAPVGLFRLDEDLRITYENARAEEIVGVPEGHAESRAIGEDIRTVPSVVETGHAELFSRLQDLETIEFEFPFESIYGEESYLSGRGVPLQDDGEFEGAIVMVNDISRHKKHERELERERDRFATLFEHLPNPVVHTELVDGEPSIRQVNPAWEETFGYDAEAVVGEHPQELIVPEDRRSDAAQLEERVLSEGAVRDVVERQTVDGRREFVLDVVQEPDGTEGYAIYTDVTERYPGE